MPEPKLTQEQERDEQICLETLACMWAYRQRWPKKWQSGKNEVIADA